MNVFVYPLDSRLLMGVPYLRTLLKETDMEIYDTNGRFIVGELPFTQKILCTHGNCLYTMLWEEPEEEQIQLNPKIICYQLK